MLLKNNKLTIFYITFSSKDDVIKVANRVMEAHLGTCINIVENVTSVYELDGKIEISSEAIMIVKTLKKHSRQVAELIKKHHPYSIPCIISFDCNSHNKKYNDWLMGLIKNT